MNRLPNEILHDIFIQLPFKQRLECMLVCLYWCNALRKRSLLYDINIRGDEKFDKFIDMLSDFPSRGSQVEILNLKLSSSHGFDKRRLCNMLPNLCKFEFESNSFTLQNPDFFSKPVELVNPNSKLKVIKDSVNCEFTRQLLMFGSCAHLRRLELPYTCTIEHRKDIFIHLKSAPALKELILESFQIAIEDLEIIHKNVPTLETLELDEVVLIPGELPHDIIPATSLKAFLTVFDDVREYPDYPDWYKYLAKKYPNLENYQCKDPNLIEVDSNQSMEIYRDGIIPLYKNIGHHLDHFNACNIPTELDAFNILDQLGLQITNFKLDNNDERPIFEQLAESNQAKHTRVLEIEYTEIASPIMFKHFTSLKEIYIDRELHNPYMTINLTDYLNAFPATLTKFSALVLNVELNDSLLHPNNITSFRLTCSTISPKLTKIISDYFPKLTFIALCGLVIEDLSLNLPKNHFDGVDIRVRSNREQSHGFSVTYSGNSQTQYYTRDPHDEFATLKMVTAEEIQDQIRIDLDFASAEECWLSSYPVNPGM